MRLGVYSSAGQKTCQYQLPGSSGSETVDANDYQNWGVRYLKYGNCFNSNPTFDSFTAMQKALTGKQIFFAIDNGNNDND